MHNPVFSYALTVTVKKKVGSRFVHVVCETIRRREFVSEPTNSMQENGILVALNYEIGVPCIVQWGLLSFSQLGQKFADTGTIFAKCHTVTNLKLTAFWWIAVLDGSGQVSIQRWARQ